MPEALSAARLTETLEVRCKDGSLFRLPFKAAKSDLEPVSYIYLFFDQQPKEAALPPAEPPLQRMRQESWDESPASTKRC